TLTVDRVLEIALEIPQTIALAGAHGASRNSGDLRNHLLDVFLADRGTLRLGAAGDLKVTVRSPVNLALGLLGAPDARTRSHLVDHVDGLVGKKTIGQVPDRKLDRGADRLVRVPNLMEIFE